MIEAICWSPDGKYLAAGNNRSTIVIWDIASGKRVQTLYGHTAAVLSIDWNPDSVRLASGGVDGTVRIWNALTAKTLTELVAASGPVWHVDWHPDGKNLLATYAWNRGLNRLKVWDITTGQETLDRLIDYVRFVEFSPDGTRVGFPHGVAAYPRGVMDLKREEIVWLKTATAYGLAAWSPDGGRLASTTDTGPICIWDAKTGDVVSSIATNAEQWAPPAWSPKGRSLAASCTDQTVKVWDTAHARSLSLCPCPSSVGPR